MSAQIKEARGNGLGLRVCVLGVCVFGVTNIRAEVASQSAEPLEVEFVLLHHLQRALKLLFRLQLLFECIIRSLKNASSPLGLLSTSPLELSYRTSPLELSYRTSPLVNLVHRQQLKNKSFEVHILLI